MTTNNGGSPFGITRRTMLKATAATTVGAALFSSSAAATEPVQINWCGCSQVCLEEGAGGSYLVILAKEANGGWEFEAVAETRVQENSPKGFCNDDGESGEYKIIAVVPVVPGKNTEGKGEDSDGILAYENNVVYYANPGRCAMDALNSFGDGIIPVSGSNNYDEFDTSTVFEYDGPDIYVNGRCGEPGKGDPEDEPPRSPPEEPPQGPPE